MAQFVHETLTDEMKGKVVDWLNQVIETKGECVIDKENGLCSNLHEVLGEDDDDIDGAYELVFEVTRNVWPDHTTWAYPIEGNYRRYEENLDKWAEGSAYCEMRIELAGYVRDVLLGKLKLTVTHEGVIV